MSFETTTLLNDDSNDISLASLQKMLPSANTNYDDSFKSPTEMMEQDVATAAASRRNSRVRRRRRRNQHRPVVRRHSSFELRHKSALEKRQANMNEFLNDIKDANTGFHDSIMDFANISSEEEEAAQQHQTTKSFAESCPILSYFDSDGEDSIDLARERRPSLSSIADVAAPAEAMQITDTDVMLDESEETAASGVPAMTNYVLALPECVTESARQEARGRTKKRRSYTRKRKERARARQARGLVGTTDAATTAQTYHASLANWYESYTDETASAPITPQATAARRSNNTNWIDEQLSGEEDEGDEQKKKPSHANDDGDDLGSSLAAFLQEYNSNRQDYESEVSSGGDEKFCSDDAVA